MEPAVVGSHGRDVAAIVSLAVALANAVTMAMTMVVTVTVALGTQWPWA